MAVKNKAEEIWKRGKAGAIPRGLQPMLATLATLPDEDGSWLYELKWDGYRAIAYLDGKQVHIASRNNKSFDEKFYPVHEALGKWPVKAVVDGEIVVLQQDGTPDFGALQQWRSEADGQLVYYIFDLLWYDGKSLMHLPLEERKQALKEIFPEHIAALRLSGSIEAQGDAVFKFASQLHLEGIIAKKKASVYDAGNRSRDWLKIKTEKMQELVIGGYTLNEGSGKLFSALLLGIFQGSSFEFVTPVGTGFSRKQQEAILQKLKPLITANSPFATEPEFNKPSRFRPNPPPATVTWVKPQVVAEISYREKTSGGAIRHPSFRGLREDKKAREVVWEELPATPSNFKAVKQPVLKAPPKAERSTLLNPKEASQTREVSGHELKFTNLNKRYWEKEKITKRELINYYYQVAPFMLPYLKDRPQTLNRHPNGIEGKSFYQKDIKGKVPEWIERFPYYSQGDEKEKEFFVCTNEASLLYLASLGCIEINPWHSTTNKPDNPTWCIIDLDPANNSFNQVIEAACVTREVLESVGINGYCKTSGSTGLHIYIPLGGRYSYEDSRELGRRIARVVHHQLPKFTSIERKTADRGGKMYIDFLQNRPQATVAAPYSLRPKPGAPVSMPLHWEEVKKGLRIKDFNIHNAVERLGSEGDLFKPVLGKAIALKAAVRALHRQFKEVLGP